MLIIAESHHVFDAHDIRACYYTVDKEKQVSVHIGYPSDQPVKPESDHQCTVHNVIYSAHNMDLCLALIKCITASLTSNCKVFDVNANVERIVQLEQWVEAVVFIIEGIIEVGNRPTTAEVARQLEDEMKGYGIYDEDASEFVTLMIDAGILSIEHHIISINNKTPTMLEVLDALLGINDHSPVLDVNEPGE